MRKDLYPYMFKTIIDLIGYLNYLEATKGEDKYAQDSVLIDVLKQCEPSWTNLTAISLSETAIYRK